MLTKGYVGNDDESDQRVPCIRSIGTMRSDLKMVEV